MAGSPEILVSTDEIRQQNILFVSKCYQLASCVVLLYDHLLTIDLEVERVWRRSLTPPDVLFTLNRYFPLISYIWIITANHQTTWSPSVCHVFLHFPLVMALISDMVIGAIIFLRLYAMYFGKRHVLFLLASLATVLYSFEAWAAASVALSDVSPIRGCIVTVKDDRYYVFGLLWAWSVLYDCTICVLTVCRSLRNRYSCQGIQTPLFDLLLRDGVMYFVGMTTVKIANFVIFWTVSRDLVTINWTFNHTITVILISHLFFNLRGERSASVYSSQSTAFPTVSGISVFSPLAVYSEPAEIASKI